MQIAVDVDGRRIVLDDDPFADLDDGGVHHPAVRTCYAAAHVVLRDDYADVPHRPESPGSAAEIAGFVDPLATAALRRHLDAHGFGIAEAMDTAQRFELGWPAAERLIRSTGGLGIERGVVAGVGTDQLGREPRDLDEVVAAVGEQARVVRAAGALPVLLPIPTLLRIGLDADGFVAAHERLLTAIDGPLILHWLGPMFAPGLAGYFPGDSFRRILALDPTQVRGCKLSLLDTDLELGVRREILVRDQVVFTGDDFHFGELILGGDPGDPGRGAPAVERVGELSGRPLALGDFSHALLGILDGIAAPFGRALRLLAAGDVAGYRRIARACEALGQHVFAPPTRHYKAGLAFLSWLNGRQDNYMLVNHVERCRDRAHYLRCAELAAAAGAIEDAEVAAERLARFAAGAD